MNIKYHNLCSDRENETALEWMTTKRSNRQNNKQNKTKPARAIEREGEGGGEGIKRAKGEFGRYEALNNYG